MTLKTGFDSPAPSKRLDAIVEASELSDDESLVKLVEKLRSTDPVERMFAIRSLEIREGTTLGYDHAAPSWQRLESYYQWVKHLDAKGIKTIGLEHEPIDDEADDEGDDDTDDGADGETGMKEPMES